MTALLLGAPQRAVRPAADSAPARPRHAPGCRGAARHRRERGDGASARGSAAASRHRPRVFICWNVGTLLGALVGGGLADPRALGLDAAAPAAFLALLAPQPRGTRRGGGRRSPRAAAALVAVPLDAGRRARPRRRAASPWRAAVMWTAILLAAGGCYLLKLAGLSVPASRAGAPARRARRGARAGRAARRADRDEHADGRRPHAGPRRAGGRRGGRRRGAAPAGAVPRRGGGRDGHDRPAPGSCDQAGSYDGEAVATRGWGRGPGAECHARDDQREAGDDRAEELERRLEAQRRHDEPARIAGSDSDA